MLRVIEIVVEKLVFPHGAAVEIRYNIEVCSSCCSVGEVQRVNKGGSMVDFGRANVRNRINRVEGADVLCFSFERKGESLGGAITAKSGYATEGVINEKWRKRRYEP